MKKQILRVIAIAIAIAAVVQVIYQGPTASAKETRGGDKTDGKEPGV